MMSTVPPTPSLMLHEGMPGHGRLTIDKLKSKFRGCSLSEKDGIARTAIQPLIDQFVQAIDSTRQSINEFIDAHPYAFNGGSQVATAKLSKFVEQTRFRWDQLISSLKIKG
jgi:hypothetical protein